MGTYIEFVIGFEVLECVGRHWRKLSRSEFDVRDEIDNRKDVERMNNLELEEFIFVFKEFTMVCILRVEA